MQLSKYSFPYFSEILLNQIKNAHFVSVDFEIIGLHLDKFLINSSFDSFQERYLKSQISMSTFNPIQLGLSTFNLKSSSLLEVNPYTIYLSPDYRLNSKDLVWQASTLEFLAENNFDLNAVIYEGIKPNDIIHLDKNESIKWKRYRRDLNILIKEHDCNSLESELHITDFTPQLAKFLEEFCVSKKFNFKWEHKTFKTSVMKVFPAKEESVLEEFTLADYPENLYSLSDILKELSNKTLIVHNGNLDLMHLYQLSTGNVLPKELTEFTKEVHRLFPKIFDTKYILSSSLQTSSLASKSKDLKTSFECILREFKDSKEKFKLSVSLPEDCQEYGKCLEEGGDFGFAHDAGFDSFITGTLFYMLSKLLKIRNSESFEYNYFSNKIATSSIGFPVELDQEIQFENRGHRIFSVTILDNKTHDVVEMQKFLDFQFGENSVKVNRTFDEKIFIISPVNISILNFLEQQIDTHKFIALTSPEGFSLKIEEYTETLKTKLSSINESREMPKIYEEIINS